MKEKLLIEAINKHVGTFMELSLEQKKEKLLDQIKKVIPMLEQRIKETKHPEGTVLETLYKRYVRAEEILLYHKEDIGKILIDGGCRAYHDEFFEYEGNPLTDEMFKAELMFREIWLKEIPKNKM